jgi:sirohydrochlorin cobaltochelatase
MPALLEMNDMPATSSTRSCSKPAALTTGLCLAALGAFAADKAEEKSGNATSGMDHSQMDHSGHSMDTTRDAEGRSLYGMKHKMDPAMTKELREKVALYKNYSDAEIALSMDMMGPEYAWYISPPDVKGEQGVLILMHGFREQGDKMFRQQVQPMGDIFPTSMGVGMAMMMSDHIQVALDDLKAAGAKKIAVVPITSSGTNELYRQWLYIFGKEDKPEFASVPRVKTDAKLLFVKPPGDDPLVAEVLLDHALELSQDPKKEVVIIAGHGPSSAEDNAEELRVLAGLAKIIKKDGGFADVRGMTLQDDAPPEIRDANVKKLREVVEAAAKNGQRVLVVTNLIGARTIQAKLRSDLKGLDFEFNAKGLINHPNFMKWMGEAVREQFERDS